MYRMIFLLILPFLVGNATAGIDLSLKQQIPVIASKVTAIRIGPDSKFMAYGDDNGLIYVCDLPQMKQIHRLDYHEKEITCLLFDPEHEYLISGSNDKKIAVWNLNSGNLEIKINDFKDELRCLVLSPDHQILAACGEKKEIYLWEYPLGKQRGRLKGHDKDAVFIAFNQNGSQLLSIGEDKNVITWDLNDLKPARKVQINPQIFENSGSDIVSAAASPDRSFLAVGLEERVLKKGFNRPTDLSGFADDPRSGMRPAQPGSVTHDMVFNYYIAFYDWETGAEIEMLSGQGKNIDYLAITPDKYYVVADNSTLKKNRLGFIDIKRGIIELVYPMDGAVSKVAFSQDGKWMAAGQTVDAESLESYVNIWSLEGIDAYVQVEGGKPVYSPGPFGPSFSITSSDDPVLQSDRPISVAVLYLEGSGVPAELARGLTHSIETQLAKSSSVTLVERNQIDKVIDELKLQSSGFTTKQAARIGNFVNAEYVLIGSITRLEDLMIITVKFVDVTTSAVVGIREVQGKDATLEDAGRMIMILGPTLAK